MKQLIKYAVVFWWMLVYTPLCAQDMVFTQPMSGLLYTNPAYSGAWAPYRLGTAVRSQMSALENPYNTFYVDFDLYAATIQSGFGLYVMNDASDVWQTTSVGLSYAYAFHISENIVLRPALQAVYYRQGQNSRSYTFPDGINGSGSNTGVVYPVMNESLQGFDFASGMLLSHPAWEAGLAVGHIGSSRNDSLMVYANRSLKWTVHARAAISLAGEATLQDLDFSEWNTFENVKIMPYAMASYQGDYRMLVLGAQVQAGALFSGANIKSDWAFESACLGLAAGLASSRFRMGYNIDIVSFGSQLKRWSSASHELYIHFAFGEVAEKSMKSKKKWRKKSNCIGCPY